MSGCWRAAGQRRTHGADLDLAGARLRETSKPTTGLPSSSAAARGSATVSLTWPPGRGAAAAVGSASQPPARGRLHRGQGAHRLLGAAQVGAAARALQLHLAQLARDVGRRGAQRLQRSGSSATRTSRSTPPTR
jgi:hypothetical protein